MKSGNYILVIAPKEYPGKKYRGRYCYEHHLVWWRETGLSLKEGEVIHHKNENKHDNRIENLELKTNSSHTVGHNKERRKHPEFVEIVCDFCGKKRQEPGHTYAWKVKVGKKFFCSLVCSGKYTKREKRHGTDSCYNYGKCRCHECKNAHNLKQKEYRKNKGT